MKIESLFLAFAIMTWPISSASESAAEDPIWNAFSPVHSDVDVELQDWFESAYLPNLESKEFHLRSRFAEIDSSELDRRFKASLDDVERFDQDSRGNYIYPESLDNSESDILLVMFPEVAYRIAVVRHEVGRNSGM